MGKIKGKYCFKVACKLRQLPTSNDECGRPAWWDPMCWCLVTKLLHWVYFLDRHVMTIAPVCQAAATLNVQLHSSEGLNTLTVKCFRRRVWETRHSGATGWELLSHFSEVWSLSSLQLTRSSNWQRESLFRCQMWQHWMYVPNNCSKSDNWSRLTWFHINSRVLEIKLSQRCIVTADISHWVASSNFFVERKFYCHACSLNIAFGRAG
jgi:hypothetical protein